ncbi:hypothetical protein PQX77_009871 [Marasmius sp. AFHP31]|nr:hypothetical protein PQX77_009871 [Marasmius sp. AFHP31]
MSDAEPTSTSFTEEPITPTTSITSDATATIPSSESQTVSDTESTLSTSPSTSASLSSVNNNESTTTTTDMDSDSAVVPTSVSSTDSAGADTPTQTETQSKETTTTSAGDDDSQEESPPTSSAEVPPPTSTSDPVETIVTSEGTPTQTEEPPVTTETGDSATIAEEFPTTAGSSEVETMTTSETSPTQTEDPPVTTATGDGTTTTEDPPTTTVSSDPSTEPTQTEGATTTTEDSPTTTATSEGTSQPTQTEAPPVTTTTSESTSADTTPTSTDLTTSDTDVTATATPPESDQRTAITTTSESSPTSVLESTSDQGTVAAVPETSTELTSVTSATSESNQAPATTLGFLSGTGSVSATGTAATTTVTGTGSGSAPLSVSALTLSPLRSPSIVTLTATETLTSDGLTITTRLGSTLTVTPTDTLSTLVASDLNILTQAPVSEPERARLDLSSTSVPIATVLTTEFVTSTLSDGDTTLIPTRTRTTTVTGSGVPTYTLQPNAFERNKGAIIGVIIVAALLAGIGIFVGIWLCRRRKRKVEGRRYNPSPVGDVTTGRVLIPGFDSSFAGDRERGSGRWRPPLVEEFGDEEGGDIYTRPSRSMSQRSRGTSIRPVTSYRDRDGDSGDVRSITSGGQVSTNTMHFGTSLLSFDGPGHPQFQHYQPNGNPSRFSDSSLGSSGPSEEGTGTVRTASLISLSAEPTPLDGQFPRSGSSATNSQQHGEIPIISPFADAFSISHHNQSSSSSHGTPTRSQSLGSQNSGNAQSLTSLDQDRGWREIEIQDPSDVPRPRGGNPSASSPAVSPNPFLYEDEEDEDEESPPPSLMTQMSRISLMSQQQSLTHSDSGSTSSLLNPPTRPQFRGRLTDLIQSSHPPTLPPIPLIASPALTDVTEESYLGSSYQFQPEGLIDTRAQRSEESLLDHVDYTRPISMAVSGTDSQRDSLADHRIVFSRLSATETETSSTNESLSDFEARTTQEDVRRYRDDEDPFQDPQSQRDLMHDASPVLMVLQRAAASRASLTSSPPSSPARPGFGNS